MWFANALARPTSADPTAARRELSAIKAAYDVRSGATPQRVADAFAAHARKVLALGSWSDFLAGMRCGLVRGRHPRCTFAAMLRQAVLDSHAAGYHSSPCPMPPGFICQQCLARVRGARGAVGSKGQRAPPPFIQWARERPVGVVSDSWLG